MPISPGLAQTATQDTQDGIHTRQVSRLGVAVSGGALVWAAGVAAVGSSPTTARDISIGDLSALPFQLGLFALLRVQWRTRATGTSRAAVAMLQVEHVLLALATL